MRRSLPAVSLLIAAMPLAASAQTKPSSAVAAGKPCKASDVGKVVVGPKSTQLQCVKSGSKYVYRVAATTPTTVTSATAAPTAVTPTTIATPASAPTTVGSAASAAAKEKWPDKLVFAPVPAENASAANLNWGPFVRGLERELGVKIEQVNLTDYAAVIEAQLSGKVDLAMYGPFSYYLAKQAGARIDSVAIMVNSIGASPTYQSYFVAKPDSSIKSLADAKGKKICFVDPASTSGYLVPWEGLQNTGIDPTKDVTAVFAGGHDRSALAVKAGTCDAGFVFDDMFDKLLPERGQLKSGELSIVWKSKPIPNSPIAVRSDLPADLVAKMKKTIPLIDTLYIQGNKLCNGGGNTCTLNGSSNAWILAGDNFFKPIDDICKATKAPACVPAKK